MKYLVLLVAALGFSAGAKAAEDVEFKQSGEFRARYFNDLNSTGQEASGQKADTTGRLKYNLSARKGEKLQAFLGVIHNSQFGANNTADGDYSTVAASNLLIVNRAWGWWKATDSLSFKLGRIGIEIADGAVFAENDWENFPTAHEGLDILWDLDFAKLNFFAVKTHEYGAVAGNSDPERNFYMISADIKNMPETVKMANIHILQVNKDEATGSLPVVGSQNFQHFGLTIGGDVNNIMYKATAAFQTGVYNKITTAPGSEQKLNTNMFDVMVGYGLPETMGLKFSVGYHMDSGDSDAADDKQENYQTLYYDRHNYAGLMDVVRWGNLTYWNLNSSIMPAEDLEVGAGFYMFDRTKDTGATTFGPRFSTLTGTGTSKPIGSEFDLYANKAYDGGFKIGARFGAFMPGDFLKNTTPPQDKTLLQAMLQASMAF